MARAAIEDAAMRLFLAQGFDAVTVADIAKDVDVAVQTVFNHVPAKHDTHWSADHGARTVRSPQSAHHGS